MERSLTPYFLAVRELVNAADPYDLLSLGASAADGKGATAFVTGSRR